MPGKLARLPSVEARIAWRPQARVPPEVRRELERLVADLAPVLSEVETDVDTLSRRASCGLEWLLPHIELTLPLYERGRVYRLRFFRDDATDIALVTRSGARVATIRLVG